MSSLQGQFLVASTKLRDPNFDNTIVFIVEHNDEGALGLIMNRPMTTTIDEVWEQVSQSPCLRGDSLNQGGPCEGMLMVLHGDASVEDTEVIPGVYFSTEKDSVETIVAGVGNDEHPARFFIGYAGWTAGQLEGEMEAGAWHATPAEAPEVFESDPSFWNRVRRHVWLQAAYPWLQPELIPDDPNVN